MNHARILSCMILMFFPLLTCSGEDLPVENRKLSIWFNLGYQYLGPSGSNDQYEAGNNDFPVTPGHDAVHARFLVGYRFLPKTEILADLTIFAAIRVTKIDPSDNDEVTVETAGRMGLGLSAHHYLKEGLISHYLSLSMGIDRIYADPFTTGTKYGYLYVSELPERSTDFFASVGFGSQLRFDVMLKAFVDLRLMTIFDPDGLVWGISTSVGVGFYF